MKYKKVFLNLLTEHNFEQQLINFREQMGNNKQVDVFIFMEPQFWIEYTNDRKLSKQFKMANFSRDTKYVQKKIFVDKMLTNKAKKSHSIRPIEKSKMLH